MTDCSNDGSWSFQTSSLLYPFDWEVEGGPNLFDLVVERKYVPCNWKARGLAEDTDTVQHDDQTDEAADDSLAIAEEVRRPVLEETVLAKTHH